MSHSSRPTRMLPWIGSNVPPASSPSSTEIEFFQLIDSILSAQSKYVEATNLNDRAHIIQHQLAHITALHTLLQSSSVSSSLLGRLFDPIYLPLFTLLANHPDVKAQQAERERKNRSTASSPVTPIPLPTESISPLEPRVWELALECLERLLRAASQQPKLARAAMTKRLFGIMQLVLQFITKRDGKEKEKDESNSPSHPSMSATHPIPSATATSTLASAASFHHSEELRMIAMSCLRALFECVESQFSSSITLFSTSFASVGSSSELSPLLETFQSHPGFIISLGYYIHTLTRCATKERHRGLRILAIESLAQVVRVLKHKQLNTTNHNAASTHSSDPRGSPIPGIILLLAYFPGLVSSLYTILLYDASSATHSGGWKFRLVTWELFDQLIRTIVNYVGGSAKIMKELREYDVNTAQESAQLDGDEEPYETDKSSTVSNTMARLFSLIPASASDDATHTPLTLTSATSPSIALDHLHPILQSVLKPIDLPWWLETRKNITEMMTKLFNATQLTARKEIAIVMLRSVERYIIGDSPSGAQHDGDDDDEDFFLFTSSPNGGTIYSILLPSCTLTWLEYIIYCHEHDDPLLRTTAGAIFQRLGDKLHSLDSASLDLLRTRFQTSTNRLSPLTSAPTPAPSLVPILRTSLHRHLLQLPRTLATASESQQITRLRTVKGYISLLGQQPEALWQFMNDDITRVLKVMYNTWTVEGETSKVLEREQDTTQSNVGMLKDNPASIEANTDTEIVPSPTALSLPTYYSIGFTSLHSPLAHSLSIAILESIGYHVGAQFGLLLGHFHEKLVAGIREVEQGNFSPTNQLKESIMFMNHLILGIGAAIRDGKVSVGEIYPHVEVVLMEYLTPTLWHIASLQAFRGRRLKEEEQQRNKIIVSLLIRGLGDMAVAIGRDWRYQLMHLLYPLFEKLGSPHVHLHQAALATLHRIAYACGYGEDEASSTGTVPTPDSTLQAMLVDNMDYLVEQMSVELRTDQAIGGEGFGQGQGRAHPLTLPLVLSALLTKISLSCTKAIIPLLDDVLKVILDKLCELSLQHDDLDIEPPFESSSFPHDYDFTHMSRLAYLEILRSVATAIHLIQESQNLAPVAMPAIYSSTPPIQLLEEKKSMITTEQDQKLIANAAADEAKALQEVDAMLDLSAYEDSKPDEKSTKPTPKTSSTNLDSFASSKSVRTRLLNLLRTRNEQAERGRFELDWLNRKAEDGADASESKSDDGKTDGQRWYEEREAYRQREAEKKYNTINGIDDPEAEADMENEAKAHSDPPEPPMTRDQETVLEIFQQCRNFLVPGSGTRALAMQVAVLKIVEESLPVLERRPKELFPAIAQFWPALLQSLKIAENVAVASSNSSSRHLSSSSWSTHHRGGFESSVVTASAASPMTALTNVERDAEQESKDRQLQQLIESLSNTNASTSVSTRVNASSLLHHSHSTASPLFIESLNVLALLARTASKFLAGRFTNELWPMLQGVLGLSTQWLHSTRHRGGTKRTAIEEGALRIQPIYKVQKALLETLVELVRFPDLSQHHLRTIAEHVAPYLSSEQPSEFQQLAVKIFRILHQQDRFVAWFVLWQISPKGMAEEAQEVTTGSDSSRPITSASSTPTFFHHPCFSQVFPNFDGNFLAAQRMDRPRIVTNPNPAPTNGGSDVYQENVRECRRQIGKDPIPELKLVL